MSGQPVVSPYHYSDASGKGVDVEVNKSLLATRKNRFCIGKFPNSVPFLPKLF
jgi:hypothetical protein